MSQRRSSLPNAPADDTTPTFDYNDPANNAPESVTAPEAGTEPLYEDGEQETLASMVDLTADDVPAFRIDTPWAVDANGTELPTTYSVNGTTLSQTVDTRGAAFPVVADPAFIPVIIWLTVAAARTSVLA
ncbi:hypothetical protein ACQP2E_15825 [Actinoplanes sp. CA-015351]|uniref:hypothetical protein n=1 Tax=Actinoplanes sp. CA-015351 TaxID=3239897 RepID=UPI003D99A5CA